MENLVTSKEVSEKLKKLGVKAESHFRWSNTYTQVGGHRWFLVSEDKVKAENWHPDLWIHGIPAYIISELKEPLKPYMKDIEISARDDIFNPDFWGNYLISRLTK